MDFLVRDAEVVYMKEIDRKAKEIEKKIGTKFSRNDYIKMLIQNDAELRLIKLKEDKYDQSVDNLTLTLNRQTETLQEYINNTNRLFHLISSGVDIYEGADDL